MKEVSVIICLLLLSVVSGKDLTCKAGEGVFDYTVYASGSQCTGLSKITTAEECKLAAEYNRKNNIDNNNIKIFGKWNNHQIPTGCIYNSYTNSYRFNGATGTTKCSDTYKCVCKKKRISKCLRHTYSEGGINAVCTPCPSDTYTLLNSKQDSKSLCKAILECRPGEGMPPRDIRTSGTCSRLSKITTVAECKAAAELNNKKSAGFVNYGFGGETAAYNYPHGCFYSTREKIVSVFGDAKDKYILNSYTHKSKCTEKYPCICKKKTCMKCPIDTYSEGYQSLCLPCISPLLTNTERTRCVNPADLLETVREDLDEQKENTNDLSIKNSRLWQKETIRLQHDKLMQERKNDDNNNEQSACEDERKDGTIIFPAMEISNEIEKIEDTTCIDTNRDELLKSFCSFTSDLDNLFQIQSIDKEAKSFWPNICCKERRDKTLEACEDSTGKIKREKIIPFALSQGGEYSRHNLYVEVTDTIKKSGYLHEGMLQLLDSLESIRNSKKQNAKNLVDSFFNDVSLCGPRIVDAPGNSENKLCELFVPYKHAMKNFYSLIENLYMQPMPIQTSFLETMERSLRIRSGAKRVGKTNNMQQVMQMKPAAKTPKAEQQCKHTESGSTWTSKNLAKMKQTYCTGYNHLDLSSTEIKNIAIHYLKNDIAYDDKKMFSLKQSLRYEIDDASCPAAPLFTANDISIQQVAMDVLGKKKEWVAVVNLNTQDKNGYLQSELPYCEEKTYLIGAKVNVKAYVDRTNYCGKIADYDTCKKKCLTECGKRSIFSRVCSKVCSKRMVQLKNRYNNKHYSKDVVLMGTQYTVDDSHVSRRRRLLSHKRTGC
jgi:hypothetical protein